LTFLQNCLQITLRKTVDKSFIEVEVFNVNNA